MSASAENQASAPARNHLAFRHVDRRGRVQLLPLSNEAQKLAATGIPGTPIHHAPGNGPQAGRDFHGTRSSLTAREWQVFDLLISGLSNKQMAHELSISCRTVEIHRAHLLQKMGVRNAASLVRIALTAA